MTDDLERLTAEAAALDAAALEPVPDAAGSKTEPEQAAPDVPGEIAALLKTTALLLAPMYPSLATIYTEETCRALGVAAAPVLDKYGLSVGGLFDRWGAEITLAATALPIAAATYQGIKSDLAAKRKPAAPDKPREPTPPPSAETPPEAAAGMMVIPAPR